MNNTYRSERKIFTIVSKQSSTSNSNGANNNARGAYILGSSSFINSRMGAVLDAFSHNGMQFFQFAVAGQGSSALATQYTTAGLNTNPLTQIVCIGMSFWNDANSSPFTNTGASLTAWNTWKANLEQVIGFCRRDGHIPVIFAPSPNNTVVGMSLFLTVWNQWANNLDCNVFSLASIIIDPTTGLYLPSCTDENLHPNFLACSYMIQGIPVDYFKRITSYKTVITPQTGYARRQALTTATIAPYRLYHPPVQRGTQFYANGINIDTPLTCTNPHTLVMEFRLTNTVFRIWGWVISELSQTQIQNAGLNGSIYGSAAGIGTFNIYSGTITGGTVAGNLLAPNAPSTMFPNPTPNVWYKLVVRYSPVDSVLRLSLIDVVAKTVTNGISTVGIGVTVGIGTNTYHYLIHDIARSSGSSGVGSTGTFDLRSVAYYQTNLNDYEVNTIASSGIYYPGLVGYWQFGDSQQLDAPIGLLPYQVGLSCPLPSIWSNIASS